MAKKSKKAVGSNVKLIRKANELVEARYKFDIWETRVFAKMLTMLKPSDADFKMYNLYIGDLLKDFNLSDAGDNYMAVKQAAKKLISRVIEIERETADGVMMWYAMPLLVGATGFKEPKDGNYISVQFHNELKPYLLELKERYLQYDIRNLWGLTSVYSVRMYELLKQYEKIGKRHFDLPDLRNRLVIEGTDYQKYSHLKEKVIMKAHEDLKNHTDIYFEIQEHKDGKKVSAITFFVFPNSNAIITPPPIEEDEDATPLETPRFPAVPPDEFESLLKLVSPWGVTPAKLRKLILQYGQPAIIDGIACTLEGKTTANKAGFFIKAVEQGWQSPRQAKQAQEEIEKAQALENLQKQMALLENLESERRAAANEIIRVLTQSDAFLAGEAINKILASNPVRKALEHQTGLTLNATMEMDVWRQSKPLRDAIIRQIEVMHPEHFKAVKGKYDAAISKMRQNIEVLQGKVG